MSDNREKLQEEIKVQGEVVRKLKAAKEPKAKVSFTKVMQFFDFHWSITLFKRSPMCSEVGILINVHLALIFTQDSFSFHCQLRRTF